MMIDKVVSVTVIMPVLAAVALFWASNDVSVGSRILCAGAVAGTIGTLVDWMAVIMVFQRKWWIPFSGVIPRNKDALCAEIAQMVETEWFTPDAVRKHLEGVDLVGPLRESVEGFLLSDRAQARLENHLLGTAATKLEDPETAAYVEREVDGAFSRWFGQWPEPFRVIGFTNLGQGIVRGMELPAKVRDLVFSAAASALERTASTGSLRTALAVESRRLLNCLFTDDLEVDLRESLIAAIFTHVRVGEVVKRNLDSLSSEAIRLMVERKAKTHLEWIRVNGAIGGFVLGTLMESLRIVVGV